MKFQVPQFIDIEDKIFGPLTFKQFIYLAGGAGASVVLYFFVPLIIAIPLIVIIIGFSVALAFYKMNNKSFISILEASLRYAIGNKLYIWKKEAKKPEAKEKDTAPEELYVPKLSESKLKDLSWSLDVHDNVQGETSDKQ